MKHSLHLHDAMLWSSIQFNTLKNTNLDPIFISHCQVSNFVWLLKFNTELFVFETNTIEIEPTAK